MNCDNCHDEATVHITEIHGGKPANVHLCGQCADAVYAGAASPKHATEAPSMHYLLISLVMRRGSEMFLIAGSPPLIRVEAGLKELAPRTLSVSDTRTLGESIAPESALLRCRKEGWAEFVDTMRPVNARPIDLCFTMLKQGDGYAMTIRRAPEVGFSAAAG